MKISKASKVSADNVMTYNGIYYVKYHKHRDDPFICQAPDDVNAKVCDSCPLWNDCGSKEYYDVWERVSKLHSRDE